MTATFGTLGGAVGRRIRVLVADDHAIVRQGVVTVLRDAPGIAVVAEAADGAAAVARYAEHRPDVALVDLEMPGLDGADVVAAVRARYPDARFILLTTYDADDDIERALRAGAKAYLLKDVDPQELVACVRAVDQGRAWASPAVAAKLATRLTRVELTPRERTVLRELAAGKSNKEIAAALGIVESTVKLHVTHLYEKLGVSSRTEALAAAVGRGLVRLP
ncbi:DNA-binding response regulator [Gemmatimonadetes bacterium T265]|nr:DNA-binding response regulator [Gemmatimonadetes bacterium T265]